MAHLSGHERSQLLLLPEAVDGYVGPDDPVRFIEAFVGELGLAAAGFACVVPKATGWPGCDPADLLKLCIYGCLDRVRSSRRLDAETRRNIEVIWLLRGVRPDFKAIADFRGNNPAAFRPVFRAFVLLCRQLDLFGRALSAVDGTRIKAAGNKHRTVTRAALTRFVQQADETLAGPLKRLDKGDADEDGSDGGRGPGREDPRLAERIAAVRGKRERHRTLPEEPDRAGEDQISLTDPDSRAMARMTKVGVGCNGQVAVDAKHKLIVEQEVHSPVVDMGLLAATATAAMEARGGERIEAVADRGHFRTEDIEACKAAGLTPCVPEPVRGSAVREGFFPKEAFRFDPAPDTLTCPGGQTLRPCKRGRSRDSIKIGHSNREACLGCQLRPRCTRTCRHVSRLENEAVLDRMAARLAACPEVLDQRRTCVEHPFGTVRQ